MNKMLKQYLKLSKWADVLKMEFREGINENIMEIKNKKSHENFGVFAKMKKSVAFFGANSGHGKCEKGGKNDL